jgi:hypothetical protein
MGVPLFLQGSPYHPRHPMPVALTTLFAGAKGAGCERASYDLRLAVTVERDRRQHHQAEGHPHPFLGLLPLRRGAGAFRHTIHCLG